MRIKPVDNVYFGAHLPNKQIMTNRMKQYWMKVKYSEPVRCDNPLWMLTQGLYRSVEAVYKTYEHQAAAMGYEILEVKVLED